MEISVHFELHSKNFRNRYLYVKIKENKESKFRMITKINKRKYVPASIFAENFSNILVILHIFKSNFCILFSNNMPSKILCCKKVPHILAEKTHNI